MKRRVIIFIILVLLSPMLASAQIKTPSVYKNSVKMNLVGMALHNISLLYERSLNEHWSLQAGAGYRWGGDIPKAFGLGGGVQFGYQFIFKERFLVDFMFAGPRLSSNKINFSLESDYLEELVPIIEDEINEKLEWLGMDPISIDSSTDLEAKFGFRYFRYGISFGFLF